MHFIAHIGCCTATAANALAQAGTLVPTMEALTIGADFVALTTRTQAMTRDPFTGTPVAPATAIVAVADNAAPWAAAMMWTGVTESGTWLTKGPVIIACAMMSGKSFIDSCELTGHGSGNSGKGSLYGRVNHFAATEHTRKGF